MTTVEAYLALNLLPGIGPVRVRRLVEAFGSPQAILRATRDQLLKVEGIGREFASLIADWEDQIDLQEELALIREAGVKVLSHACEAFPAPLRQIYDPPLVLYVWGTLEKRDWRAIGVVGSRRATHYGLQSAKKLSYQLARGGFTVLSGLARGIDTAAHEGALAAGGRTVAVIGSGLNRLYPPENQALAEKITQSGAVVSEFPMRYPPDKQSFPLRNRIVSGWSSGILVVEAPGRSGALITANQAGEQGRNVYAVPGPIDRPTSTGCNRLIQDGAKLVLSAEDIFEDFGPVQLDFPEPVAAETPAETAPRFAGDLSADERAILDILSSTEIDIESVIQQTGLPPALVSTTLMRLEMKRLVKPLPGKNFVKLI